MLYPVLWQTRWNTSTMATRARSRYLGVKPSLVSPIPGIVALQTGDEVNLTVPAAVPATEDWLKVLVGPEA
jgi:hypothetical protein